MYELNQTNQFRKDLKRILKRDRTDFDRSFEIITMLRNKGVKGIPASMKPHRLKGRNKNNWECHIKPDLLIIWMQREEPKIITLIRIGSHSDLF